jgi:hypothetical protein
MNISELGRCMKEPSFSALKDIEIANFLTLHVNDSELAKMDPKRLRTIIETLIIPKAKKTSTFCEKCFKFAFVILFVIDDYLEMPPR